MIYRCGLLYAHTHGNSAAEIEPTARGFGQKWESESGPHPDSDSADIAVVGCVCPFER